MYTNNNKNGGEDSEELLKRNQRADFKSFWDRLKD